MDPRYFAHSLTLYEAELFVKGLRRREYPAWHRARYTAFYSAAPHCKNLKYDDMGHFPWEHEDDSEAMSREEQEKALKALRKRALQLDRKLLKNKKKWHRVT